MTFAAARPPLHGGGELPFGPTTVLMGANDAGKTSLLRLLGNVLDGRPVSASIHLRAAPHELEVLRLDPAEVRVEASPTENGRWRYRAGDTVAESDLPLMPEAVGVPTNVARLGTDIAHGVNELLAAMIATGQSVTGSQVDTLVSQAITADLPDFVRRAYRVQISTAGSTSTPAVAPVTGEAPFRLAALAQGYLLWVQLAIYDTLDRVERQAVHLEELITSAPAEATRHATHLIDARGLSEDPPDADSVVLPSDPLLLRRRLSLLRPRVYLIDEPEQHLHPAACREAQLWLVSRMDRARELAVVATHHPAFLTGDSGTTFVHLDRIPPAAAEVRAFDGHELTTLSRRFEALGYDRGELFALLRGVLLVEGWHDETVLSHLLADELKQLRIVIEPVGGTGSFACSDLGLVARLTRVPIAVLVDGVPDHLLAPLAQNPEAFAPPSAPQPDSHGAYRGELDALRGLLLYPRVGMTRPMLCTLPAADVLDLLDRRARKLLRQKIAERRPKNRGGLLTSPIAKVPVKELLRLGDQDVRRHALSIAAADQYQRRGTPTALEPLVRRLRTLVGQDPVRQLAHQSVEES